jgi:hypothetical protein
MKILLGTPVYGGMICVKYFKSILETLAFFRQEFPQIQIDVRAISGSVLPTTRNILASLVLNDPSYTHVLFIDSDISFSSSLVVKMIDFHKPVVGCVCPTKRFDYNLFHASRRACKDPKVARYLAIDYAGGDDALIGTTGPDGKRRMPVVDGFVRVRYASTGIMLIRRDALEALKQAFPDLWVANPGAPYEKFELEGVLQCFDSFPGPDRLFPTEDMAFCRRWVDGCGGEIWSCVDETITLIGQELFVGQYLSKMRHGDLHIVDLPSSALRSPELTSLR